MGCASSKNHRRCRHCRRGDSPAMGSRSYSMHAHHPATHTGDSYHMVALTSSTIGSLGSHDKDLDEVTSKLLSNNNEERMSLDLQAKLLEAKVWSSLINHKIPKLAPKTPIVTPPGEPENINAWELMEGLEDITPLRSPNHSRSFSFDLVHSGHVPLKGDDPSFDRPKSSFHETRNVQSLLTYHTKEDECDPGCGIIEFDPEIISSFRKSLQEVSPDHPFHIRIPDLQKNPNLEFLDEQEEEKEETLDDPIYKTMEIGKEKLIVYFTSLRGIRKTYEDCCHVRVVLKGHGVRVDERDVSMHSGFKDEIKELLNQDKLSKRVGITLPRVFLGKKYLGGAEEIRRLDEEGKLEKLLEGCERVEDNKGGSECEACGDIRFVPCDTCSGSCKVYYEEQDDDGDDDDDDDDDGEETEYGFQRCPDCNENGLIRCLVCCDY